MIEKLCVDEIFRLIFCSGYSSDLLELNTIHTRYDVTDVMWFLIDPYFFVTKRFLILVLCRPTQNSIYLASRITYTAFQFLFFQLLKWRIFENELLRDTYLFSAEDKLF